jgi:hypothetical protein
VDLVVNAQNLACRVDDRRTVAAQPVRAALGEPRLQNPVSPSSGSTTYVPASTCASRSIRSIVARLAGLSSHAMSNWTAATRMVEV